MAQYDYEYFSDVLAFDAMYKNKAYTYPLITLVGTNHHHRAIMFGFANDPKVHEYILGDENR